MCYHIFANFHRNSKYTYKCIQINHTKETVKIKEEQLLTSQFLQIFQYQSAIVLRCET